MTPCRGVGSADRVLGGIVREKLGPTIRVYFRPGQAPLRLSPLDRSRREKIEKLAGNLGVHTEPAAGENGWVLWSGIGVQNQANNGEKFSVKSFPD